MKLFDNIERGLFDKAVECDCGDFDYSFETEKYQVNLYTEVDSKKVFNLHGGSNGHLCYDVKNVEIIDENNKDVVHLFPLFVERLKKIVPDYDDVLTYIQESRMTPEELYFGSTQNYLSYRYGN